MEKIAIYPGSFDPITLGHVSIIKKGIAIFDKVIVALAYDSSKRNFFSIDQRFEMIQSVVNDEFELSKNVEVVMFKGLLADFMRINRYKVLMRGLRAVSDFEYEFKMNWIITKSNPKIHTVFMPADESTQFVSSTMIREFIRLKGNVDNFVPKTVLKYV
ncbi:pantetheine-phosphate adenylyltransferase [Anaplasmataceae bacterium AB001_6]|nr:pantetheine-phosphate adenylyltransferase [Anaplasmataceae bacterium AB001_6]